MNAEKPETKQITENIPEATANFEGSDTLLLFERLGSEKILKQLTTTLRAGHVARAGSGRLVQREVLDENNEPKRNPDGSFVLIETPYEVPTEEDIRVQILSRIEEAKLVTNISFGDGSPTADCIPVNWRLLSGEIPTDKQKSIMEAHEKGHNIRVFGGGLEGDKYYKKLFSAAFDFSYMNYTNEDYQNDKKRLEGEGGEEIDLREAREIIVGYLDDPAELIERMSQIKNYFGFSGAETFTQKHLQFARSYYVKDTEFDNHMRHFFESIIDDGEFVRLMNDLGV